MNRRYSFITTVLLAVALQSCSEEPLPAKTSAPITRLLTVHASPTLNPAMAVELYTADVLLGSNNRRANLMFGAAGTTSPTAGEVFLKARLGPTAETPFVQGTYAAQDYTHYMALIGNADASNTTAEAPVGIAVLEDNLASPGAGNARVRVIHLGIEAPAVDLYLYTGDVQPDPIFTGITYAKSFPGNVSIPFQESGVAGPVVADFVTVPSGGYNFRVRPAGAAPDAPTVLTGTTTLAEGRTYTLIVRGFLTPPPGVSGRALSLQSVLHDLTVY